MTIEEYNELKQKVLNLRQTAIYEQGTEGHAKIYDELRNLEELLQNAKIVDNTLEKNIVSKIEIVDNSNILEKPLSR